MYSMIVTAKMNDVDPQAWLADVLARIERAVPAEAVAGARYNEQGMATLDSERRR